MLMKVLPNPPFAFSLTENWLYEQWQSNKSNTKSASKTKLFSSHHIKKHLHMWKLVGKQHLY